MSSVYEIFGINVDPDEVGCFQAQSNLLSIQCEVILGRQQFKIKPLYLCQNAVLSMQIKDSNWVYVVVLGSGKPDNCDLTWVEIVKKYNKYFHPIGGNGWPKEPPNYIAFRY